MQITRYLKPVFVGVAGTSLVATWLFFSGLTHRSEDAAVVYERVNISGTPAFFYSKGQCRGVFYITDSPASGSPVTPYKQLISHVNAKC